MASEYTISYPTGLFIAVEKQSFFMLAFEEMLLSNHNIIPIFGPATKKNTCQIKFNYLGRKSYQPESFVSDVEKALEFLRTNMGILGPKKFSKRKRKSNSFQASPQIITLEDEHEVSTVDLTEGGQREPEVISLEDSIVHSGRITRQTSMCGSVVDLTEVNEDKTPAKRKLSDIDIQILSVKRFKPQQVNKTVSSDEITVLDNLITLTNTKKRKKKKKNRRTLTKTMNSNKLDFSSSPSSNDFEPRKKRKLQDICNTGFGASCSSPPSFTQPSALSENTLKYYEQISKVVGNAAREKRRSSPRTKMRACNQVVNNLKRKNKSIIKQMSPVRVCLEANKKRKIFFPQNSPIHKITQNHQKRFEETSLRRVSPRILSRKILQRGARKRISETNSFNPNPLEVDLEGLRPIAIDGSNVAIGHGNGRFSPKGLKICVDYFATRGHTKIKVFLPQFRHEEIPPELLEALKTKCDVVFTPSQEINGIRRTPYDDRFIVQYATEFGGVIVSTDNYRDLSKENPRWQDTVAKRLLMFTWVDDFLMFPVDPLGRSGPTLEEFLRF